MSKGRGHLDPVGLGALSAEVGRDVAAVLGMLTEMERLVVTLRFGLDDGEPRTYRQVAAELGDFPGWIQARERDALEKLRLPAVGRTLRTALDHLDEDGVSARVLDRGRAAAAEREGLLFCARHGWTVRHAAVRTCPACPCLLPDNDRAGRPRRYCSAACRQAAYRRRHR